MKSDILSAKSFTFFKSTKTTILRTDASDRAIGAVLIQKNEHGNEKLISFTSTSLKGSQKGYDIIYREFVAIFHALKKFRHYLNGVSFKIRLH